MWYVIALTLLYGPYNATLEEVIDAETLKLNVAVWPEEDKVLEIGVVGLDTPSVDGECDVEKLLAKEAMEMTRVFIGDQVRLTAVRKSAVNGNYYAKIFNKKGELLSEALIEAGYGAPYVKGKKASWCP